MPIFADLGFVLLNGKVSEVALPFRCQNRLHNLRYVNNILFQSPLQVPERSICNFGK